MNTKFSSSNRTLMHSAILLSVLSLVACDGGSSDSTNSDILESDPDAQTSSDDETDSDLLPDFVVQDFSLSPTYDRGELISIFLSVANIGEGKNLVPPAWLMVSDTEDFSTGYAMYPFTPRSTSDTSELIISPGEEHSFRASIDLPLSYNGTHYARVWLNPDRSAYFVNPEDSVVPSFETPEINTDNNLSEITTFEATGVRVGDCVPDALEENDTLATAAPILLDTEYMINDCIEQLDIFSIDLQAGSTYELRTFDGPDNTVTEINSWPHAIVDQTGAYLERPSAVSPLLFQPVTTGQHYIVLRRIVAFSGQGREFGFTVNSVP